MFERIKAWLKGQLPAKKSATAPAHSTSSTSQIDHEDTPHVLPYDETLLERCRTQWQLGDWAGLTQLNRETLQHHPDRAKLALFAAAGHLQSNNAPSAQRFIRLAQDWGCRRRHISEILISGVHNSLGRAAAANAQQNCALQHFNIAIQVLASESDSRLLALARAKNQINQLAFSLHESNVESVKAITTCLKPFHHLSSNLWKPGASIPKANSKLKISEESIDQESKHIPDEDLSNISYDLLRKTQTTDILVIFSTPRSGSTLLCDVLMRNDVCLAHEYFQPYQYLPLLAKRWQCIEEGVLCKSRYISSLCNYRTLANGWLGINLHSEHINIFNEFVDFFPLANFHYIHLNRKDTVAQAISYELAQQTGKWTSYFKEVKDSIYDYDAINNRLIQITEGNSLINSFVLANNIDCQTVYYEDMLFNPQSFFSSISQAHGIAEKISFNTNLTKQASELNSEWKARYYSDLSSSKAVDKVGLISFS